MGFGAKVNLLSLFISVFIPLMLFITERHCASIKAKSWPFMKTYDIWGTDAKTPNDSEEQSRKKHTEPEYKVIKSAMNENTVLSNDNILLQDYDDHKTSFRDGKVLNFFPVPVEDECKTQDGRRTGTCMNTYDCHREGGTSKGQCALGFGVCCVFTATCDQEIRNNITYIVSPNFPALMPSNMKTCKLKIKMMSPDVSQLRFDFVHFSMGQPNRRTGHCDGDIFSLLGGVSGEFKLCGQNNGQHIYYDVLNGKARDAEANNTIEVLMNFTSAFATSRFWEIRVSQIPFSQRAPAGCLQYFTGNEGIIQTFNFAENGRHLANQNYKACIRQEKGMCSIAYEPCNDQSFKIGPTIMMNPAYNGYNPMGTYGGMNYINSNGFNGLNTGALPNQMDLANLNALNLNMANMPLTNPAFAMNMQLQNGALSPAGLPGTVNGQPSIGTNGIGMPGLGMPGMGGITPGAGAGTAAVPGVGAAGSTMTANDPQQIGQLTQADGIGNSTSTNAAATNTSTIGSSTIAPISSTTSPAVPTTTIAPSADDPDAVEGSGDGADDDANSLFSIGSFLTRAVLFRSFSKRNARQFFSTCTDRITLPCIVEDFIGTGMGHVPECTPIHCGRSLCSGTFPCRIESTVKPFAIGIHFGDGLLKGSPEDNIGACLRFNQMNCV